MIHFPGHWLEWLKDTSSLTETLSNPTTGTRVTLSLPEIEFRIHVALFVIRKIEESIGISLKLSDTKVSLSHWPVTEEKKAEILRTPDPDLGEWYQLKTSQQELVSYKRIIDIFIHARICNFSFARPIKSFSEDISFFVASDHTMRDRIISVPIGVLHSLLKQAISIFEPIVLRRARKKT